MLKNLRKDPKLVSVVTNCVGFNVCAHDGRGINTIETGTGETCLTIELSPEEVALSRAIAETILMQIDDYLDRRNNEEVQDS